MLLCTNEASDITGCCAAAQGTLDATSNSELGVGKISESETSGGIQPSAFMLNSDVP